MQSFFLTYRSSRIHFLQGGHGDKILLCFHGYGETAASFAFLEGPLGTAFTLLAIDLPFHGKTEWNEGMSFSMESLLEILQGIELLKDLADGTGTPTPGKKQARILLTGFSMGGRIALSLLEKIPDRVEKIILLAPDGLTVNPWYWLATQTRPGNRIFRYTMKHPGWFFLVLRIGNLLGAVNPSVYKFTRNYVDNPAVREALYHRWTVLRNFRPDIPVITSLVRERRIPVRLLYGQYDRIIRSGKGERFKKNIDPFGELFLLPSGHQLLLEKHLEPIRFALKD
ncbi:MAG: alpha/beta hydrolase [Puia sp.]|nr:alpha/beta hydrolase [Puia sp.]